MAGPEAMATVAKDSRTTREEVADGHKARAGLPYSLQAKACATLVINACVTATTVGIAMRPARVGNAATVGTSAIT